MEIIVISSPDLIENEAEVINALFNAGMHLFHIRKPNASLPELRKLLKDIDPGYRAMLVLHQHQVLCDEYRLNRRHYPEALRRQHDASYFADQRQRGIKLSTSIHKLESLPEFTAFDYVFFSPVFNSISKPGYQTNIPANFTLPEKSGLPGVIALGGIEACNVEKVSAMNFDGIAVLGAIWNRGGSPLKNFKQIQYACSVIKVQEPKTLNLIQ